MEKITVELNDKQYEFLVNWQKKHETELGIDVPLGALVRKAVDAAMNADAKHDARPPRDDRAPRAPRAGGSDRRDAGPRGSRSFGARPGMGSRPVGRPSPRPSSGPRSDIYGDRKRAAGKK